MNTKVFIQIKKLMTNIYIHIRKPADITKSAPFLTVLVLLVISILGFVVIRHFEPEMPCIISEPHLILSEIMKYLLKRYMIHITEDKKLLSALSE